MSTKTTKIDLERQMLGEVEVSFGARGCPCSRSSTTWKAARPSTSASRNIPSVSKEQARAALSLARDYMVTRARSA